MTKKMVPIQKSEAQSFTVNPTVNRDHYERMARFVNAFGAISFLLGDQSNSSEPPANELYCLLDILNDEGQEALKAIEPDYYTPREKEVAQ